MKSVLFFLPLALSVLPVAAAPTHLVDEKPVSITRISDTVTLVDFGRVSFGNVRLTPPAGAKGKITLHFGEAFQDQRVLRTPPGTVRYAKAEVTLAGAKPIVAAPPADKRNTKKTNDRHPPAILTPAEWGVVLPFRWLEVEGWPGELTAHHLTRQSAYSATWDDDAASFKCSDEMLNRIWDLCRYSIKATTFAGLYVDGDRERIPYEADSYLNQLSHYYTDNDIVMARETFVRLKGFATWPTEWAPHMVFMAHADWRHTGDAEWLAKHYEFLKGKLLMERVGPDGLVTSTPAQIKRGDIVDWPKGERDGYVFTKKNTVVNAFHLRAVEQMAEMARVLGKDKEADEYAARYRTTLAAFQKAFFNAKTGRYRDGVGTDHSSQHANLFPLAFDLVPAEHVARVRKFVVSRGMACSVYAAQYLMEAIFAHDGAEHALALMTAPGDRSWRHMVESGTTISWEAWDLKYKPNQDWNHAWGAAPANLLPRFVLGVEVAEPGWKRARIRPQVGSLTMAEGKVPTTRGPIEVSWRNDQKQFAMTLALPDGMSASLDLPADGGASQVLVNDQVVAATKESGRLVVAAPVTGTLKVVVK